MGLLWVGVCRTEIIYLKETDFPSAGLLHPGLGQAKASRLELRLSLPSWVAGSHVLQLYSYCLLGSALVGSWTGMEHGHRQSAS